MAHQQVALKTAQIAAQPLEGLGRQAAKGEHARRIRFTTSGLPVSYSEIAQEVGELAKSTKVRLAGAQYSQNAVTGRRGRDSSRR